nr:HAMP domain-containing protein [Actinomycetota bacterium]
MSRLPIRLRVTMAFAVSIAFVLAAFGLFLYLRFESQLDEAVDNSLEVRASDLSALIDEDAGDDGLVFPTLDPEDSFAQVLSPAGRTVLSTAQLDAGSVLDADARAHGKVGASFSERDEVPGLDGRVRILATPIQVDGRTLVAVVGASLEDRDESLSQLALLLLLGGPAALALATLAGYWAAGRALGPVERMRSEAEAITAEAPGGRLAVPVADDELRRLGTTLNEMLVRLEGAIERERQFVDDASHELRTPLALHKTELELAQRYAADEGELRKAIASGIEEVDRLAQLADDLLVAARSGEDGLALSTERLDVGDLFQTVATRFHSRAGAAGREVEAGSAAGISIHGDRLRLEQALTNMVENALRHGAG